MQPSLEDLWIKVRELLKDEMSRISYETWIRDLCLISVEDNLITLRAKDTFKKEAAETRFFDLITNTFNFILNKQCELTVLLQDSSVSSDSETIEKTTSFPVFENRYSNLNPKYTFDTFVVGNNNSFANAAARAVAESNKYNPLFIYSKVGLGKTHLMHAIGNEIVKNKKDLIVVYVSSETFTNELVNAIKDKSPEQFRAKYRNVDVLLIDDIQFLAKKEGIQEEFFHTFNTLYENAKQIVIASDRPPKDIHPLEERLKSRFEWGLLADMSAPNYETRLAILRKKAAEDHLLIDDTILVEIATKIESNIRELEGVLNSVMAESSLSYEKITPEMLAKVINTVKSAKENVVSVEKIQEVVAKYFNIKPSDFQTSGRTNDIAYPRQIAMYLCKNIIGLSFIKIGEVFGGKHHSTVIFACNKIEQELKQVKETELIIESLKGIILNKTD